VKGRGIESQGVGLPRLDARPIVHGNIGPTVSVVLFMLYHEICHRYHEVVSDFKRRYVAALLGLVHNQATSFAMTI
jgi:hypothetical protein